MKRSGVDPRNWALFAREELPSYLAGVGVDSADAQAAGDDVYARGCALAQLSDDERLPLSIAFFEETYFYTPEAAGDLGLQVPPA